MIRKKNRLKRWEIARKYDKNRNEIKHTHSEAWRVPRMNRINHIIFFLAHHEHIRVRRQKQEQLLFISVLCIQFKIISMFLLPVFPRTRPQYIFFSLVVSCYALIRINNYPVCVQCLWHGLDSVLLTIAFASSSSFPISSE